MFFKSLCLFNFQRGSWAPGSKHQKHMTYNPTNFLYRFPGHNGPGPFTMKYFWTLGCFPTGLSTPFRLQEFLLYYQQQHVPQEVVEWLKFFVIDPVEILTQSVEEFIENIETVPLTERARGYVAHESNIVCLIPSLRKVERELGITLSLVGIRSALSKSESRNSLLDDLWNYHEFLQENGSTPHRRRAREWLETPLSSQEESELKFISLSSLSKDENKEFNSLVGSAISPLSSTADDERYLIRFCTTIAEECTRKNHYDDAYSLTASLLSFAHDSETKAIIQANAASAAITSGMFSDGAFHAKEAALFEPSIRCANDISLRGYCLWAASLAYQDDYTTALGIIDNALTMYVGNKELLRLREQVLNVVKNNEIKTALVCKGKRAMLESQQLQGLMRGDGVSFDNTFDSIIHNGKTYTSKMNPSTNEMGSVFWRVGLPSQHISTSYSMESI